MLDVFESGRHGCVAGLTRYKTHTESSHTISKDCAQQARFLVCCSDVGTIFLSFRTYCWRGCSSRLKTLNLNQTEPPAAVRTAKYCCRYTYDIHGSTTRASNKYERPHHIPHVLAYAQPLAPVQSVPRRPRPSAARPSGPKTPPRPAGTPPATAKRRITSPTPGGGRRETFSAAPTTVNQTSSSPSNGSPQGPKGNSAASADDLNRTFSPGYLRERPSKFWVTPEHGGGGDPPASGPFAPLEDRVDPAENRTASGPLPPLEDRVAPKELGVERNNETENVSGTKGNSHHQTESEQGKEAIVTTDRVENGMNQQAEEQAGGTSGAATEEAKELAPSGDLDAEPAVDPLAGKDVLEWTAADVRTWIRALPRGLATFAEAEAFAKGRVDGKKLATLTLSDIKRKEFRHAKFKAKVGADWSVRLADLPPCAGGTLRSARVGSRSRPTSAARGV